jgi:hypothetical protein
MPTYLCVLPNSISYNSPSPAFLPGIFVYIPLHLLKSIFMTVRAKFVCDSVIPGNDEGQTVVHLSAVTNGSPENESFAKATPAGQLQLVIDAGTPAAEAFESGVEYYIDIIRAEATETAESDAPAE